MISDNSAGLENMGSKFDITFRTLKLREIPLVNFISTYLQSRIISEPKNYNTL